MLDNSDALKRGSKAGGDDDAYYSRKQTVCTVFRSTSIRSPEMKGQAVMWVTALLASFSPGRTRYLVELQITQCPVASFRLLVQTL